LARDAFIGKMSLINLAKHSDRNFGDKTERMRRFRLLKIIGDQSLKSKFFHGCQVHSVQCSTETIQTMARVLDFSQIEDSTGKAASVERFAA
jgi:hypothetical protein